MALKDFLLMNVDNLFNKDKKGKDTSKKVEFEDFEYEDGIITLGGSSKNSSNDSDLSGWVLSSSGLKELNEQTERIKNSDEEDARAARIKAAMESEDGSVKLSIDDVLSEKSNNIFLEKFGSMEVEESDDVEVDEAESPSEASNVNAVTNNEPAEKVVKQTPQPKSRKATEMVEITNTEAPVVQAPVVENAVPVVENVGTQAPVNNAPVNNVPGVGVVENNIPVFEPGIANEAVQPVIQEREIVILEGEMDYRYLNCWDAITAESYRVYTNQKDLKIFEPVIKLSEGGTEPLDRICVYDGGNYWQFVTYGLTELFQKKQKNLDISGLGMEFTLKLKKDNYSNVDAEFKSILRNLQAIARLSFLKGKLFYPYDIVYTGQTKGIDSRMSSNITGLFTIQDTTFKNMVTRNGRVQFVQFVGATDAELKAVLTKQTDVKGLYQKIGSDLTNYNRQSVF